MSYTRRNITAISLLLTISIFICIHLLNSQISLLFQKPYSSNSNTVYSKKIPIEKQIKNLQSIAINTDNLFEYFRPKTQTVSILQQEMQNAQTEQKDNKTQRETIQENKASAWRISIPKLGLDVHIEEGTSQDILLKAVGHFEETTKWKGNVCLAAHNRGYKCNFFQKIKQLKIGDEIIYYTKQGKRVYKVQTNKVILETDWTYIKETKENRITLITCEENRPEYRRCVQAVQIMDI